MSSRRKFFKAAAVTGAAAVAMPYVKAHAAKTLKMQAAWPSGANIFFEMAGDYAKMAICLEENLKLTFSQLVLL